MHFVATRLAGAWMIEPDERSDARGSLVRTYCAQEFGGRGLCTRWVQSSTVFTARAGTLRGLHFQRSPFAEAKLIRCTSGAVYDVILDLRPASPTYLHWYATELTARNRRAIYVPEGCAHGVQTRTDATEMLYMMSEFYMPEAAWGVRWNDPAFAIAWPEPPGGDRLLSANDQQWPDFQP